LADLCETGTGDCRDRTNDTETVKVLARQAKQWLITRHRPVTRPAIRKQVEQEWAALWSGFDPKQTSLGKILTGRSAYRMVLEETVAESDNLRRNLADKIRRFPHGVWKRVWQDPELCNVEKGKSGRPRK
jgi:hypothetical protein